MVQCSGSILQNGVIKHQAGKAGGGIMVEGGFRELAFYGRVSPINLLSLKRGFGLFGSLDQILSN